MEVDINHKLYFFGELQHWVDLAVCRLSLAPGFGSEGGREMDGPLYRMLLDISAEISGNLVFEAYAKKILEWGSYRHTEAVTRGRWNTLGVAAAVHSATYAAEGGGSISGRRLLLGFFESPELQVAKSRDASRMR